MDYGGRAQESGNYNKFKEAIQNVDLQIELPNK